MNDPDDLVEDAAIDSLRNINEKAVPEEIRKMVVCPTATGANFARNYDPVNTPIKRSESMKRWAFGRSAIVLFSGVLTVGCTLSTHAQEKSSAAGYHLLKKISLPPAPGGDEYYDYIAIDADARRVYVSHGTEVVVLNADDDSVVGRVSGLTRCHGIAVVPEMGKGFVSDGDSHSGPEVQKAVVFDLKTLKVTGEIKTNQVDTDAIIYEPVTKHIFTFNGDSETATVIDAEKETVITNIKLGGAVEFPAVDGKGTVYDNIQEKNEIGVIDARTNTVKAHWPTAPEGHPVAMAIDQKNRRLFSSGRGPQITAMFDADNGKLIQSFPISSGVDANAFEPKTGMLFVSTKEGMIHIFHEDSPDKLSEVGTIKTEFGAKTIQVDPKTHKLYLSTSDFSPAAAPTEKQPHPQPKPKPGNFHVLVYGR
jgi:DNA-binding beta-propeller fold protein YncE